MGSVVTEDSETSAGYEDAQDDHSPTPAREGYVDPLTGQYNLFEE